MQTIRSYTAPAKQWQKNWKGAAIRASNLSELELTLGRLPDAVTDARQSITHADQSGDAFQRMSKRATAADALHQSGQRAAAGTLFAEAERMQQEWQPQFDLLYSLQGFRYCDWLLAPPNRPRGERCSPPVSRKALAAGLQSRNLGAKNRRLAPCRSRRRSR